MMESDKMYTELIKIIEGGLKGDKEKVYNYATILSENLIKNGETNLAKRITNAINSKKGSMVSLDSFNVKPVDVESRLDMVDVVYVGDEFLDPILSKHTKKSVNDLVLSYSKRDDILKAGIQSTNSLLLYGPPGCGKTTVAKYIAKQTNLPLVTVRLDGMVSSLLGSTAKNIRKIFDYASKRECILFLDEFDVIAKLRDDKNDLGELKRVVNSLLQNIDDFSGNSILIAATNHHQLLDPAVWRRFNNVLSLDIPRYKEREEYILRLLEKYPNDITQNKNKLDFINKALKGKSYSDIENIIHNSIKVAIISSNDDLFSYNLLFDIYKHDNHELKSEDEIIQYLLNYNVTHRELNEQLGFSLRKVREVSKNNLI